MKKKRHIIKNKIKEENVLERDLKVREKMFKYKLSFGYFMMNSF